MAANIGRTGSVPEWPKGTGCKPVGLRLRRFKSSSAHARASLLSQACFRVRPAWAAASARRALRTLDEVTRTLARGVCALMMLSLLAAACGSDGATLGPAAEPTETVASGDEPTTVPDATPSETALGDDGPTPEEGVEVGVGTTAPEVIMDITGDPKAGQNVQTTVLNMTIEPEKSGTDHVPGEGHMHVYVNGEFVAEAYNDWLHLALEPGDQTVTVELSANDHRPYTVNGVAIVAVARLTVRATDETPGHPGVIEVASATAPGLQLEVTKDPVSGWRVYAPTTNFVLAPERASTPHIDGEGHMHLSIDGQKVTRLYGPWWHIAELTEGDHEVTVSLNANDHSAYVMDGMPIFASVTLTVAAEDATPDGGGAADPDPDVGAIEVTYDQGQVIVADDRIDIGRGDEVTLTIESDVADHVHIHGYDLFVDVGPEAAASITFTADIPGVFEVEFEDSATLITELVVS